jgi:hypothetical protein
MNIVITSVCANLVLGCMLRNMECLLRLRDCFGSLMFGRRFKMSMYDTKVDYIEAFLQFRIFKVRLMPKFYGIDLALFHVCSNIV